MEMTEKSILVFGKAVLVTAVLLAAVLFSGCFGGTEAEMRQVEWSRPSPAFYERAEANAKASAARKEEARREAEGRE